jgi:CheY-like chemotaxis protein
MFRILIVEDIKGTLKELTEFISAAFEEPDGEINVSIHAAESVSEAKQLIEEAHGKRRPYHAVILDFMLPPQPGKQTAIDESLCALIRISMKSTLVAHITMYTEDPAVKDHLRRVHQEEIHPQSFALAKSDGRYAIELVKKLRTFLYGKRIEEQMNLLFGEQAELSYIARGRGRAVPNRSKIERDSTLDIASLRRDIVAHWPDLDERLKERIQLVFRVDPDSKPVRISLVREGECRLGEGTTI